MQEKLGKGYFSKHFSQHFHRQFNSRNYLHNYSVVTRLAERDGSKFNDRFDHMQIPFLSIKISAMSYLDTLNTKNSNLLNNNAKLRADLIECHSVLRSIKVILQDDNGKCDKIIKQRILGEVNFILDKVN